MSNKADSRDAGFAQTLVDSNPQAGSSEAGSSEAGGSSGTGPAKAHCPRCGAEAPLAADGSCSRCRSLVAARTLPHLTESIANVRLAEAGFQVEEDSRPGGHADPLIGIVVADRYRILELLGRGGMGIVYRVEHTRIGKQLAMKLLAGELTRNQEVVRRFKHEALTASRLSSPNTVQVFDFGVSDGLTYLVMELVTGDDLGRVLKQNGNLPAQRLGRIVVQAANSLAEAHAQGITHRDIKPENVMLLKARDGSDLVKVLDFGLAKLREGPELSELTSQGAIVGTPYFMSPEQVRGDPVDARSDIYSLGALMYRALTGVYPFSGPSPMSVFAKHLTETPRAPHEVVPTVPLPLSDIVMRALAKDPGERFQRVEDLQSAVMAMLEEIGTSGVESLLDSGALRRLQHPSIADATDVPVAATRDEVERYERKLRRARLGGTLLAMVLPLAGIGAGAHYLLKEQPTTFGGLEVEPNNTQKDATVIPFGEAVSGHLGQRMSAERGDLDFYQVEVPKSDDMTSLLLGSLPNMPICAQLFRKGDGAPLAQYCTGLPGLGLEIPMLRLSEGTYLVAVMQDLDTGAGKVSPFVHENVSDRYELRVGPAPIDPTFEVEPNDAQPSASTLGVGDTISGVLGWVGDVDVVCPNVDSNTSFRFRVDDDAREGGNVLSVALLERGIEGAPVRVHQRRTGAASSTDAPSPFTGFSFLGVAAPCLVLRAVIDPGAANNPLHSVPRGSRAKYRVTLEPAP